jgi:hypothetical protein
MVRAGHSAAVQVLIKWHGLDLAQATWEDYYQLKSRFLTLRFGRRIEFKRGRVSHLQVCRWTASRLTMMVKIRRTP